MGINPSYRVDLDGLRAVAVMPVILFHLGVQHVPGGFVGVDVFFVLSGFFITGQIAQQMSECDFSLIGFYDRRIRRLFPALFVVLLFSTIMAIMLLMPSDLKRYGRALVAAAFSISNFNFWRDTDYFGPDVATLPLLHTWSLSVEEQFYFFFPILLMALWQFNTAYRSVVLCLFALFSFSLAMYGASNYPATTFYLLPTRAWELAIGGVLALSLAPVSRVSGERIRCFGRTCRHRNRDFCLFRKYAIPWICSRIGLSRLRPGHLGRPGQHTKNRSKCGNVVPDASATCFHRPDFLQPLSLALASYSISASGFASPYHYMG